MLIGGRGVYPERDPDANAAAPPGRCADAGRCVEAEEPAYACVCVYIYIYVCMYVYAGIDVLMLADV
jgi:hypothetical protein